MAQVIVDELKAAAQDALDRGFSILTVEPHGKAPWAKYSPNAIHSSSRDPKIALKAWEDGTEANYGISCGASNLTVMDCDKGLNSIEEFEAWRKEHNIPETLTVISGRDGFGCHLFFSGAVATTKFEIGGATGDLKGLGGYVVGAGSWHPSGKQYYIYKDVDVATLPAGLAALAAVKQHVDFTPAKESGKLISLGNRRMHLMSQAGKLRNMGLSEDGIYNALKDFAENNCEDGANYPEEKLKEISHAAFNKFDATAPGPLIMSGSPDPEVDDGIPELPMAAVEGDYIGDLSVALTKGTFIPPAFARATLKTMTGAMLDGKIGFPGEETLHLRHWNALISARPESGKSVIWERCLLFMKKMLVEKYGVILPHSGFFSSGEHAIRVLAENDGRSHLAYFDEMKTLFEKGSNTGSTLFGRLLELYEQKTAGVGSIGSSKASFNDVGLNMTGGFTRDGYERSVAGKNAGGNGFLSRMVMEYSGGINHVGDWDALDPALVNAAVEHIQSSINYVVNYVGEVNKGMPFIPVENEDAKDVRGEFQVWLNDQKKRIQEETPDSGVVSRLESHFKRDLLLRVAFTPERVITKELTERSVAWAKHQLMLRETLYPVDCGNDIEKFEKRIVAAIRKQGPLTKAGVQKFSNADKSSGGYESWNRAWKSLLQADKIVVAKQKSNRGKEKYGFDDMTWSKAKQQWQEV